MQKVDTEIVFDDPQGSNSISFDDEKASDDLSKHMKIIRKCSRRKLAISAGIILVLLFCFIFIAGVISLTLGLVLTRDDDVHYPHYAPYSDVLDTIEYQIAPLNETQLRKELIPQWINSFNKNNPLFQISEDTMKHDIYSQFHYKTDACNAGNYKIRHRSFKLQNKITVDIKADKIEPGSCEKYPFWPSEDYYDVARQKCEVDAHPCFNGHSRGTSIEFENKVNLKTCGDFAKLFPGVFTDTSKYHESVKEQSVDGWWKGYWEGIAGNHTNYQITFTLRYEANYQDILSDTINFSYGEFSFRYWTPNGMEKEHLVESSFASLIYLLILDLDPKEDHIECANQFFYDVKPH